MHTATTTLRYLLNINRERLFLSLAVSVVAFFAMYIFFIQSSVFYMLSARKLSSEVSTINASVASLESTYFSLSDKVALSGAYNNGFVDATQISYLKTPSIGSNITYRSNND